MLALVRAFLRKTGLRKLALNGGVAANVKLNQRIRDLQNVESIFIHPNMGDGGCGTGAAMLEFAGSPNLMKPIEHVYLGPSYSEDEILEAQVAHTILGGEIVYGR